MTLLALALALAPPALAGWGLVRLLGLAPRGAPPVALAGSAATGMLLGVGLSSVTTFAWLLAGGTLNVAFAVTDGAVFAVAALGLGLRALRSRTPGRHGAPPALPVEARAGLPRRRADLAAGAGLVIAVIATLAITGALGSAVPHGEMDAWMMWNMKARFLLRGGAAWPAAFSPELGWTSTEYPLLLPLAIARVWAYGGESQLAPAALASLFTAGAVVALAWGAGARGCAWRAAAAPLLLVATPGFLALGASQYADVPLAAFVVAAMATLDVGDARGAPGGSRFLAGLLLGLAGWTKNEGVLAAGLVVAVAAAWDFAQHGVALATRRALVVVAGAVAPATAWLAFHGLVMPRTTGALFLGHTTETLAQQLGDAGRWHAVAASMAERLPGAQVGFPALVLALAGLAAWYARELPRSRALALAPLLMAAHALVFVLTRWNLEWHLRLAADRLILQAWPVVLAALFAGRGARPRIEPT